MGVIARQSIKGSLANYVGIAIGFLTTFFVLTSCLSQEEIGLTRVIVDAAMLFASIAQIGTNATIIRFAPHFRDPQDPHNDHGLFAWSILLPLAGFLVLSICFLFFKDNIASLYVEKSPLINRYIFWLLPMTFCALFLQIFETYASTLLEITIPRISREIVIRLLNLGSYLLYGNGVISFDTFVIFFCGSYGVAMLINLGYLIFKGKVRFKIDMQFLNRQRVRDILSYTFFLAITGLAGNAPLLNSLFLGAQGGLALAGVYTIAFYIANVVEIPGRSLNAISSPLIAQSIKDNDFEETNRLAQKVSLHQLLVAFLVFFFVFINLRALFSIIPNGAEYSAGISVVIILGASKIVQSTFNISNPLLSYGRAYRWLPLIVLFYTASIIILNYYFIPLMGLNGTAFATLISTTLYYVVLQLAVHFGMKVRLLSKAQLKVFLLALILFACNWIWDFLIASIIYQQPITDMAKVLLDACTRTAFLAGTAALSVYMLNISPEVKNLMDKVLTPILNRGNHTSNEQDDNSDNQ